MTQGLLSHKRTGRTRRDGDRANEDSHTQMADDPAQQGRQRGRPLRYGYTTGACAAAAARAATRALLTGQVVHEVTINLPAQRGVRFRVSTCELGAGQVTCGVIKDAGDDPDVTHGAEIRATVQWQDAPGVTIAGGEGVGIVTRPGLSLPVGEPAINAGPREMIRHAVLEELEGSRETAIHQRGLKVTISVPGGETIAAQTANPRLGIVGGISILGTTGVVKPYSQAAYRATIYLELKVAAHSGLRQAVLCTGRRSEDYARRVYPHWPELCFVQVGDHVGYALRQARRLGFWQVTVAGMIGKLSKLAQGRMYTHVSEGGVDLDYLAHVAAGLGVDNELVEGIRSANTAHHAQVMLRQAGVGGLEQEIARECAERVHQFVEGALDVEILLFSIKGDLLATKKLPGHCGIVPSNENDQLRHSEARPICHSEAPLIRHSEARSDEESQRPPARDASPAAQHDGSAPTRHSMNCPHSPRVLVVGVGGDGPAGLPTAVLERIAQADQLWARESLLALWPDHPAEKVVIGAGVGDMAERLRERGERRVVVLASGDPGFYGMVGTLLRYLPPEELEVIPQATSLQWAFARAAIPWNDAIFTSAHARPLAEVVAWAKRAPKLGILTDPANTPAAIARTLLDAGVEDCRAIVAENLGRLDERTVESRLAKLPEMEFAPLNVLLLIREADWRPQPAFAPRPDQAYVHRRGLITKADVRALSLARLALRETDVAWDIGAGSGAMSVEMAELAWRGRVFAVEHEPENVNYIRENARRFGALNVEVVEGRAPGALSELPRPNAAFIGGSGGQMRAILEHLRAVARPGCRIVVNLATLENLHETLTAMRSFGWSPQVAQVNLAYGSDIAGLTRLAPLNPVFIVSVELTA